jgi:hypothetical protein
VAGANFSDGNNDTYEADSNTIYDILKCFLVTTDCDLFKRVLTESQANELGTLSTHATNGVCRKMFPKLLKSYIL